VRARSTGDAIARLSALSEVRSIGDAARQCLDRDRKDAGKEDEMGDGRGATLDKGFVATDRGLRQKPCREGNRAAAPERVGPKKKDTARITCITLS
jgi:hypothetical protein